MNFTITPHPFADWFFPKVSVRVLRIFRACLGLAVLALALVWLPHVREFFTNQGIAPASYVYQTTVYSHLSIFFLYDAPWFVYACYALFILSSIAVILGVGRRFASILMYILFLSYASRFPLVFYGAIDIIHSVLFFNMFHPGEAYRNWSHGGVEERNNLVTAWSIRMIQVSLCMVYFFAGAQKIRSYTWWNGTELLDSLSTRFGAFDFYWLTRYPVVVNLMTYGSWLVEISFAFLIWNKTTHRFSFLAMLGLHLGILVVMNASLFSEVMIVNLISFINPEDETWVANLWSQYGKRLLAGWHRSRSVRRQKA